MKTKIFIGCLSVFLSLTAYADCPKEEDIKVRCPAHKQSCIFYAKGGWRQEKNLSEYSSQADLVRKIKKEVEDKKLKFYLAKAKPIGEYPKAQIDGCKYMADWNPGEPVPMTEAIYLSLRAGKKDVELKPGPWAQSLKNREYNCKGEKIEACPFTSM